jgi:hypothetical protein
MRPSIVFLAGAIVILGLVNLVLIGPDGKQFDAALPTQAIVVFIVWFVIEVGTVIFRAARHKQ